MGEFLNAACRVPRSATLCVLLDERESWERFCWVAERLVSAGVPMIQYRSKSPRDRQRLAYASYLRAVTRRADLLGDTAAPRLIINDRIDIAVAVDADGVHLGQDDLPVAVARQLLGNEAWVGVSTHNLEQLDSAVAAGADYVGIGPTFPTATKRFDHFAGLDYIRNATHATALPQFAIGGISLDKLSLVQDAGATRVAVQSAVIDAVDPAEVARTFLQRLAVSAPTTPSAPSPLGRDRGDLSSS